MSGSKSRSAGGHVAVLGGSRARPPICSCTGMSGPSLLGKRRRASLTLESGPMTSEVFAALAGAIVAGGIALIAQLIARRQTRTEALDDQRAPAHR